MIRRYTNVKHMGKGIIAFDIVKGIWLITVPDTYYKPTCEWLRNVKFSAYVDYTFTNSTREGVKQEYARK